MGPLDDDAPPPYSEADVYSQPGRDFVAADEFGDYHSSPMASRSTNIMPTTASVTTSSLFDDTDIVFTPPPSPPKATPLDLHDFSTEAVAAASATAYFVRRQPPASFAADLELPRAQRRVVIYDLPYPITADSTPNDVPYLEAVLSLRDVRIDDWNTFINYLLPHHMPRRNAAVVERKLRTEAEAASASEPDYGTHSPIAQPQSLGLGPLLTDSVNVSAKRRELDDEPTAADTPRLDSPSQTRRDVEATVRQWNAGFFGPRGILIRFGHRPGDVAGNPGEDFATVAAAAGPGDGPVPVTTTGGTSRSTWLPAYRSSETGMSGAWYSSRFSFEDHGSGYGSRRSAGNNDNAGVFDETRGGSAIATEVNRRGRKDGGAQRNDGQTQPRRHRSLSRKSTSSLSSHSSDSSFSSTTSSSSSICSVGSLLPLESLGDEQLPVVRAHLQQWLEHPDKPATDDMIKAANRDIHEAKRGLSTDALADIRVLTPAVSDSDALRLEIRALTKRWKALKRSQKQVRRQLHKQSKQQRRHIRLQRKQERKHRRKQRRQERKQDKQLRKQERKQERNQRRKQGKEKEREEENRRNRHHDDRSNGTSGGSYLREAENHSDRFFNHGYHCHPHDHGRRDRGHYVYGQHRSDRHWRGMGRDFPPSSVSPPDGPARNIPNATGVPGTTAAPGLGGFAPRLGELIASRLGGRGIGLGDVTPLLDGLFGRGSQSSPGPRDRGSSSRGGPCRGGFDTRSNRMPGAASAPPSVARYRKAAAADRATTEKQAELAQMREQLDQKVDNRQEARGANASKGGDGDDDRTHNDDGEVKAQRQEVEILSHEVSSLAQYAEHLWLEADEIYARELETGGPS